MKLINDLKVRVVAAEQNLVKIKEDIDKDNKLREDTVNH